MTPSQQCKSAGLSGVDALVLLSGVPRQTLYDWHKSRPELFALMIDGAIFRAAKARSQPA